MEARSVSVLNAYFEDRDTPPYDTFPGAFTADGLEQFCAGSRYFLAVVDTKTNEVKEVYRTPVINSKNERELSLKLLDKLHEFSARRAPDFDILLDIGTIRSFLDPLPYKWSDAVLFDLC